MKRSNSKGNRRRRNTAGGLLPGESFKRSLVSVAVDNFAPGQESDRYGRTINNYIVSTRRLDGQWSIEVEFQGEIWHLPGKVIQRLISQREAIIKEERSRRGIERHEQLAQRAREDQENAALQAIREG